MINPLHGFPRLANGPAPASFGRRSTILDGTIKVFPGPGQVPSSADGGQGDLAQPYSPPNDWIPEGYFLRRPQIVWCSAGPAIAEAFHNDAAFVEIYDMIFPALQELVASARPGLTWVYIPPFINFLDPDFPGFQYWGDDVEGPGNFAAATTPLYTAHAGPTMSEPFFGTNFLHLSFGIPFEPYGGSVLPHYVHDTPLEADPIFELGLFWIAQFTTSLMAGYAVKEWMFNDSFDPIDRARSIQDFQAASLAVGADYQYAGDAGGDSDGDVTISPEDLYAIVASYFGFS